LGVLELEGGRRDEGKGRKGRREKKGRREGGREGGREEREEEKREGGREKGRKKGREGEKIASGQKRSPCFEDQ
jgi:hypothetical protein